MYFLKSMLFHCFLLLFFFFLFFCNAVRPHDNPMQDCLPEPVIVSFLLMSLNVTLITSCCSHFPCVCAHLKLSAMWLVGNVRCSQNMLVSVPVFIVSWICFDTKKPDTTILLVFAIAKF